MTPTCAWTPSWAVSSRKTSTIRRNRVAFTGGSEHIDVPEAGGEGMADLLAEDLFEEVLAFVPGDFATDQDGLGISGHLSGPP